MIRRAAPAATIRSASLLAALHAMLAAVSAPAFAATPPAFTTPPAFIASASATTVREALPLVEDPRLEARVMAIAQELRCLVCQNETLAASHAPLAIDLRNQIRSQLSQGWSVQQVTDFMVERYGDFVLYRPRVAARTLPLWLGPFVLLLAAAVALAVVIRRHRPRPLPDLPQETRP